MNKNTNILPLSSHEKERAISIIKDDFENCSSASNTNRGKGISNKKYVMKYQEVIRHCYADGLAIRNIYKGLMKIEKYDISERTFYRLCNLYVFSNPNLQSDDMRKNTHNNLPPQQQTENNPLPEKKDHFDLSIHKDNGINKSFKHNSVPDLSEIL